MRSCLLWTVILVSGLVANDKAPDSAKQQLARLQSLVGQWRGVGQPQRGSTKDSWVAEADWAWSFEGGPSLVAKLPKGKFFSQLRLIPAAAEGHFELLATPASGDEKLQYAGQLDAQDQLVLTALHRPEGLPHRISIRFAANGDRLLMLLEKQGATAEQFSRLAEVGYTRQGSGFGKNTTDRECIVTGGLGTIEVTHAGKKYYVCCTGCRDYFNENPEKVLAEFAQRKNAEKATK